MERAPPLAFSSLPWPFHYPVLMNQICQPVSTAVTQHVTVQEHQLTLWPIKPVVVGICNGYGPLKSWWDSENTKKTTTTSYFIYKRKIWQIEWCFTVNLEGCEAKNVHFKHCEFFVNYTAISRRAHYKGFGLWSQICNKSTSPKLKLCGPAQSHTKCKLFTLFCCL